MNCTGKRCIMQFDKVDPATCKCVSYCPQATPPKTNADRIRSMTNEELADAFAMISDCMSCNCRNAEDNCSIVDGTCQQQWLKWLRQEI